MIVDPVRALADVPSVVHAAKSSVSPLPSVIPTPYVEHQEATEAGKRTLWVVFVIMLIATIAFSAMSWTIPVSKRLYHIVTTVIVMTAAISYFGMAVGDGISWNKITIEHEHKHGIPATYDTVKREVYWARYVDWCITTPLLLLDLCLVAGLNGAHITMTIIADLVMILTGLFAAFSADDSMPTKKWGWYAIACIAYLVVIWHLAIHGRAMAASKGGKVGGFFASIAGFTLILWTAYPVVWGIADGSRNVSVDGEIIAYAVLDVLAKPIFGLWLLLTHMNMPETNVDLGGFWANGFSGEGSIRVGDDDEGA